MKNILNGLSQEDCQEISNFEGELKDYGEYLAEEIMKAEDPEMVTEYEKKLDKTEKLRRDVSKTRYFGCRHYSPEAITDDEPQISCEDIREFHNNIDRMKNDVSETVPDYIYADDIDEDIAYEENFKVKFQSEVIKTEEDISEYKEDCDIETTSPSSPNAAMSVVCRVPPWEDRQECLDSYGDYDIESSGVTKQGEIIPQDSRLY